MDRCRSDSRGRSKWFVAALQACPADQRRKKRLMWWLAATVFTGMLIIALIGFHRLLSNNRAR
jgi:hypothetical protein